MDSRVKEFSGWLGSSPFNTLIEERLPLFDESTINILLSRASDTFSPDDRRFIRRVAGRHPFLLQAMAAALSETPGEDRQARAAKRFYGWISSHFDDLWRTLDDRTRTSAVVLSLAELSSHVMADGLDLSDLGQLGMFGPELQQLVEQGLAEQVDEDWQFDRRRLPHWQHEQWTVGVSSFHLVGSRLDNHWNTVRCIL